MEPHVRCGIDFYVPLVTICRSPGVSQKWHLACEKWAPISSCDIGCLSSVLKLVAGSMGQMSLRNAGARST
eukprot:5291962-Amphidinium_carterae.2